MRTPSTLNVYISFTSCICQNFSVFAGTNPITEYIEKIMENQSTMNYNSLLKKFADNQKYRNTFSFPIRDDGLNIITPEHCLKE